MAAVVHLSSPAQRSQPTIANVSVLRLLSNYLGPLLLPSPLTVRHAIATVRMTRIKGKVIEAPALCVEHAAMDPTWASTAARRPLKPVAASAPPQQMSPWTPKSSQPSTPLSTHVAVWLQLRLLSVALSVSHRVWLEVPVPQFYAGSLSTSSRGETFRIAGLGAQHELCRTLICQLGKQHIFASPSDRALQPNGLTASSGSTVLDIADAKSPRIRFAPLPTPTSAPPLLGRSSETSINGEALLEDSDESDVTESDYDSEEDAKSMKGKWYLMGMPTALFKPQYYTGKKHSTPPFQKQQHR